MQEEKRQLLNEQWIKLFSEIANVKEELIRNILADPDSWQYKCYMFKWNRRDRRY